MGFLSYNIIFDIDISNYEQTKPKYVTIFDHVVQF